MRFRYSPCALVLHVQKDALPCALITVPRVSRCCQHFPSGFDFHLELFVSYERGTPAKGLICSRER